MKGLSVLGAALAAVIFWGTDARAADVQIQGFVFGCESPSGEQLKPKFGDVDGAFLTGLPEERRACLATIDRMIYSCRENISFLSPDENAKYPDCLRIFEAQARQCISHFELQRGKCDAGGDDSGRADVRDSGSRSGAEDLSGRWVKHTDAAGADLNDKMVRTCGFGTHNEFVFRNGKIYAKVVSGGEVIDDSEMHMWELESMDSDRIVFRDGDGLEWRYNRCR